MTSRHRRPGIAAARGVLLAAGLLLAACWYPAEASNQEPSGPLAEALVQQLRTGVAGAASERDTDHLAVLIRFYDERGLTTLWVDRQGATPRAAELAAVIQATDEILATALLGPNARAAAN